ncbi:MAG: hypothetical protein ACRD3W_09070, partial [Terriglobales bacterium]
LCGSDTLSDAFEVLVLFCSCLLTGFPVVMTVPGHDLTHWIKVKGVGHECPTHTGRDVGHCRSTGWQKLIN